MDAADKAELIEFLKENLVLEASHTYGCYGSPGYIKLTLSIRGERYDYHQAPDEVITETTFDLPDKE